MRARNCLRDAGIALVCLWVISGAGTADAQSASLLTLDFYGPSPPGNGGCTSSICGAPFSSPLVAGSAGIFYGIDAPSVVFSMSPQGAISVVYSLWSAEGTGNVSPLMLASDGNLYLTARGTAVVPTTNVFRVTPAGVTTTLYSCNVQTISPQCADFGNSAPLIQGSDGNLYGVGTNTVFMLTLSGAVTVLHVFSGPDGLLPEGALVQGTDGNFYGTTSGGGANNLGTVFQITPAGVLTTLHSFAGTGGAGGATSATDGATPVGALVQGADGTFYGTTSAGGASNAGTIFSITAAGAYSLLYSFSGNPPDGLTPNGLTLGSDGNFYGTTRGGTGTVFSVTPGGALTTLYAFSGLDGATPLAVLVQGADGNFYGTTSAGGVANDGSIFKLSTGLESAANAVPPPPADVTYSANGSGNVTVSWSAVPGAVKYNVYACDADTPMTTTTATSATLTGVSGATCFAVSWVNAGGTSGPSAPATLGSGATSDPPASGGSGGGALDLWMLLTLGGAASTAARRRGIAAATLLGPLHR
jgi:uncharacterized repeat protein (TIGR03803 family)